MTGPNQIANLRILSQHIDNDSNLPARTRTEWVSAVSTFARACNRDPSEIVAEPRHLRHLMQKASWQLAGLSAGTWANVKSRLRAMLQHAGIDVDRKRKFKLAPAWQELMQLLREQRRADLSGFAGYCTARDIEPNAVSQETFALYLTYCNEMMMRTSPRWHWTAARRAWNKVVRLVPEQSLQPVELIGTALWRGPKWTTFPETLQLELETLSSWMLEGDLDGDSYDHVVRAPMKASSVRTL